LNLIYTTLSHGVKSR